MLDIRDLAVRYGEIPAVRGIDLHLEAGQMLAVLGRNGAGKTTTLRAIAGAVAADRGRVELGGEDLTGLPAEQRVRHGVVLVPEGRHLFPDLTVADNLAMGAYHRKLRRRAIAEEIEIVTEDFPRVRERLLQPAGSLSGGEQQLVAVARALMSRPRLLMADEPSLGLAPIVVEMLYELFAGLRAAGLALLVVEQYADVALSVADRAVVIDKGRVALDGDAQDLARSAELLNAYLSPDEETTP